ncbi:MAG: RluA family pseudouridine synthase [Oscillospiraceae bacterium]|nr:RluA family pseudouridine synthase [Oscillospiraceae bacterium]
MSPRRLILEIDERFDGLSIHHILRYKKKLSGTLIRRIKWLEDGILLDGERVNTRTAVRKGQTLSVRLSDPSVQSGIPPVDLPLKIVYEDRDIVIVDKDPGMPSHPGPGHWGDSLGNALIAHWGKTDPHADFHPVHRLDKGTSGLMVVAKHPYAQDRLRESLHSGGFQRSYLAVCEGKLSPAAGVIDLPIGRAEDSIIRRQVNGADSQRAVTSYQTVFAGQERSLVSLTLETGRTHQIRVHMAHIGHPLAGDFLYGKEIGAISRPALHSSRLSLLHPVTEERMRFISPLPDDMRTLFSHFLPFDQQNTVF